MQIMTVTVVGIMLAYFLGVDNDTLADWYYSRKRS